MGRRSLLGYILAYYLGTQFIVHLSQDAFLNARWGPVPLQGRTALKSETEEKEGKSIDESREVYKLDYELQAEAEAKAKAAAGSDKGGDGPSLSLPTLPTPEPAGEPVKKESVNVGGTMPDISLPNQDGQLISVSSFRSEAGPFGKNQIFGKVGKSVVLFFFAGSASPSCTKEAQAFRDRYAAFKARGAEVFGISSDSVDFQKEWKAKEGLPFDLLTDIDGKVRQSLDIPKDFFLLEGRQTYIIDDEGIIKKMYNDQFGPEKHVEVALDALAPVEIDEVPP